MNRIFRIEFRRGFYSVGFYLSILLLAAAGWISAGDILEYLAGVEYIEGGIRFLEAAYQALCSEPFALLVPVACTLAMSAAYVEDLQSGTLQYILLRTTKSRYRWSKVVNCAIFGGMAVAAAILILLVACFARCLFTSAEAAQWKTVGAAYFLSFLRRILILWLNGSFYALLGGLIATFVNNRYMTNARLVCSITKLNFLEWKKNPKIITAFVLAFVFCVMLSGRAIMFANSYDTTMQIFEPFIWAFGNGRSILLASLLLIFFFVDMPFINDATPYYLLRISRAVWVSAQLLYVVLVTVIYMAFLLGTFCLLCAPISFPGNMWSETGAMLGYSGVGSQIALPASVKTMEMSNPYKCTATIFLLMTLYTLLAATLMMVFNLMKNKFGGVLSVFILNLYGLLLDPRTIGKILNIPEEVQYKSNVISGWISPLNHATYYMHNFGYDLLPRLWHSYLILGVWILLNILLIRRLARRYQFNFS